MEFPGRWLRDALGDVADTWPETTPPEPSCASVCIPAAPHMDHASPCCREAGETWSVAASARTPLASSVHRSGHSACSPKPAT